MKLFVSAVVVANVLVGYSSATLAASLNSAVVTSGGSLVRGIDATNARRTSTGKYTVTFSNNVKDCTYVATLGATGTATPPTGFAGVGLNPSNNKKVNVVTHSANGNISSRDFHLAVICP